jgi:hypothetical protein
MMSQHFDYSNWNFALQGMYGKVCCYLGVNRLRIPNRKVEPFGNTTIPLVYMMSHRTCTNLHSSRSSLPVICPSSFWGGPQKKKGSAGAVGPSCGRGHLRGRRHARLRYVFEAAPLAYVHSVHTPRMYTTYTLPPSPHHSPHDHINSGPLVYCVSDQVSCLLRDHSCLLLCDHSTLYKSYCIYPSEPGVYVLILAFRLSLYRHPSISGYSLYLSLYLL